MVAALVLTAVPLFSVSLADDDPAQVYVVHGIPGFDLGLDANELPVDVLVDDALCLLEGFEFGQIEGPVPLSEGTYNFKISLANMDEPCSNDAVITADVPFEEGENATVIAHLTEDFAPTASKFMNDFSSTEPGRARLVAHHTAAAPTVDIDVRREAIRLSQGLTFEDVSNGDQAAEEVRPGEWNVNVLLPDTNVVAFGPTVVNLRPFTAYLVYAVGSLDNGTFTYLINAKYTKLNSNRGNNDDMDDMDDVYDDEDDDDDDDEDDDDERRERVANFIRAIFGWFGS
jgi:hypothetical protein